MIGTENSDVTAISIASRLIVVKSVLVQVNAEADITQCVIPHVRDRYSSSRHSVIRQLQSASNADTNGAARICYSNFMIIQLVK